MVEIAANVPHGKKEIARAECTTTEEKGEEEKEIKCEELENGTHQTGHLAEGRLPEPLSINTDITSDEATESLAKILIGMVFIDTVVFSMCVPLFPKIVGDFVGGKEWLWVQTMGNFFGAFAGPVLGWLSDSRGRQSVMQQSGLIGVSCCVVMGIGSWCLAEYTHPVWAVVSIGGFVLRRMNRNIPLTRALLTDITIDPAVRRTRFSYVGGLYGLGFAIGPSLSAFIIKAIHPSVVFLVASILSTGNQIILRKVLPTCPGSTSMKRKKREKETRSLSELAESVQSHPELFYILCTVLASMIAQTTYNSSVAVAVSERFDMDMTIYARVVSTFGVCYSGTQLFLLPLLTRKVFKDDSTLLCLSLLLNALTRLVVAYSDSQAVMFLTHACFAVGTATNAFVLNNMVSKAGKEVGFVGSFLGLQDSINRVSGILSPTFMSFIPDELVRGFAGDVYTGAFVSGIFYGLALLVAILSIPQSHVTAQSQGYKAVPMNAKKVE